jgi:hypothetical protein
MAYVVACRSAFAACASSSATLLSHKVFVSCVTIAHTLVEIDHEIIPQMLIHVIATCYDDCVQVEKCLKRWVAHCRKDLHASLASSCSINYYLLKGFI